jgi:hypothetical protein
LANFTLIDMAGPDVSSRNQELQIGALSPVQRIRQYFSTLPMHGGFTDSPLRR